MYPKDDNTIHITRHKVLPDLPHTRKEFKVNNNSTEQKLAHTHTEAHTQVI